ncbi:hypothetical protein F949_00763 [Acinetobacter junii NIPH 182]|uniref:nidogen-like domain-containing protein n=1 Tax=Acinetobacter junii TaxID=40215 RepID=UPI0002D12673|nr:nidogen-like domain-containing protein [Acinetobacter junii]ENV64671.1 hypothetical protein F949_00763 [Acinetobacter junii NIPH 182]
MANPIAENDYFETYDPYAPITIDVLYNDYDPDGDILRLSNAYIAFGSGFLSMNSDNTITYDPMGSSNETVSIFYTIEDTTGASSTAELIINVYQYYNNPPQAYDDYVQISPADSVTINVLENDYDQESDSLFVLDAVLYSGGGAVVINGDNTLYYEAQDYVGTAIIEYTIQDAYGGISTAYAYIDVVSSGLNYIYGTENGDILNGTENDDYIESYGGDDIVDGGLGGDYLIGGQGDDAYYVDNELDLVEELINEGLDLVVTTIDYSLNNNVENLILAGGGGLNGAGNILNNQINGNSGNNQIIGKGGDDIIYGMSGNDTLIGDEQYSNSGSLNVSDLGNTYLTSTSNSLIKNLGGDIGFGEQLLEENDDGSSNTVDISTIFTSGLNLFGSNFTELYVNNNGNLTFGGALGSYTPEVIGSTTLPMIAAFWADVDTRGLGNTLTTGGNSQGTNNVYYDVDAINGVFTATWDDVGYYDSATDKSNAFQIQLIKRGDAGDFDIIFRYEDINWTTGDASGGTSGLGGTVARVGYTNGIDMAFELPISGNQNEILNLESSLGNTGYSGLYIFNVRNGEIRSTGNDILDGGVGADLMVGGLGNDTYYVDNVGDVVTELSSEGTDKVFSSISYSLSGKFLENLELIGSANLNATGNSYNNILIGNSGSNTLIGDLGNDSLDGGLGADTLKGGLGNDIYYVENVGDIVTELYAEGTDKVFSSINYSLSGKFIENLELIGSTNLNATGNSYNNTLIGNIGNNTLNGGLGSDALKGGLGDDIYYVDHVGDIVTELYAEGMDKVFSSISYSLSGKFLENLELIGSENLNATGNSYNNILIGNSGSNTLIGDLGNDSLDGGLGVDTLKGGLGNDTYYVDHVGDIVTELYAEGTDKVFSSISYSLSGKFIENLELIGSANLNATGNSYNNILIGNIGNNVLNGGSGSDTLKGGLGNDIYYVDHVGDIVTELYAEGTDKVFSSISYSLSSTFIENLELTGSTNLNAIGNSYNNTLIGNSGSNSLIGDLGNDILDGGLGVDTLKGGLGNDIYYVDNIGDVVTELSSEGTDKVFSSISYSLSGKFLENLELIGSANLNATGNSYNNTLIGNSGSNTLIGDLGNDSLNGGLGADTLKGGLGNDIYYVDHVGDTVTELYAEGTDKVFSSISYSLSGKFIENLELIGSANLNATGNSYNNTLIGNIGNNILNGGSGSDTLKGGLGDDIYYVDHVGDIVTELYAEGTDKVFSIISYSLSGKFIENLQLLGSENLNATGNSYNNILFGNSGNNTLIGDLGSDILDGGLGADTLKGGLGNDTYYVDHVGDIVTELYAEGTDKIFSSISYSLSGKFIENLELVGSVNQNATGNSYNNILIGNSGSNTLIGDLGNDSLDGGLGTDTLKGGLGSDTYYVDHVGDIVTELYAEGTDKVFSSISYSLSGKFIENLELIGNANLNATGNSYNNTLIGNIGNNVLNGGSGADILKGGLGQDTAIYSLLVAGDALGGNGSDRWQDFNVGSSLNVNSDRIDISDLLIGFTDASVIQDFISVINNGNNTVLYLDRDGANTSYSDTLLLTLEGVSTSLNELMTNQQIII